MKKLIFFAIILLASPFWGDGRASSQTANEPGSGNALSFDGVNNRVEFSTSINNIGVTNNSLFSIECWVLSQDSLGTGLDPIGAIIGRWYGCPGSGTFSWMLNYSYGTFVFNLNNSQILGTNVTYNGVKENTYYHIAVTYDASFARMYVNGVLVGTASNPGGSTNSVPIGIGKEIYFPCGGSNGLPFTGQIDEVRIWNRVLTQIEIQENMCKKLIGNELGLVGYYRFDEGVNNTCPGGQDACDTSGNGNHGTTF